jgi:hypothetical protein
MFIPSLAFGRLIRSFHVCFSLKGPVKILLFLFQNLGANIRRLFALPNGFRKIFWIVFSTFAASLRKGLMKLKFLFIVFILPGILIGIYSQEKLQYFLNKGDVFTVSQVAKQSITQEIEGAKHEIVNDISGILEFKVVDTLADGFAIDVSFIDLTMKMTSSIQGELMNVRAQEEDPENIQSRIFHSLLNVPIHITLAKNGDVLEVQGGDSLVTKMTAASGLQDEFSINMMKASLKKEFGSEALSDSYKQMTFFYPNEKIQVGDTWENEYQGKLNARNSWKLEALGAENATIYGQADIVMDVKEPATTMLLEGVQRTSITTDLKSGFILKMTVEGFSEGYSSMAQMGEQKIPTTISSTVTYELIK